MKRGTLLSWINYVIIFFNTNYGFCDKFGKEIESKSKDKTIDYITNKFGKNSILRASALLEDSTVQERNKKYPTKFSNKRKLA